ncbi:MAG: oligosaccharide flippase family protein [Oscillospiraceae bacterium]|nr:oligosaccharide flippase family protein [Oscillospiraceae bacterium]
MNLWNKYKNMAVQAKAAIWYTICNFFQKGISFIVVPIYVRLLTTAEYGEWSVFQSWAGILIIFASLNLYAGVYTKTLVDMQDGEKRDRYTSSMQGLGTLITLGLLVMYGFTHDWCNRLLNLDTPFMLLLFLYFIVYPAFSFWGTRQRVEYRYKPMVAVTVAISILTPAVSILLLQYSELRAKALILGFLSTQCAVGLVFYIYHFWKGSCFYDKEYWSYAIKFNIPLIPHYLSLIVLGQSDRIMIKHFCGDSDAGIYSFAYQIASAINVLISAINGSRVPWTYDQLKARVYMQLKKITNVLVVMMAGITLLICLVSPEIIGILGTEEYKIAMYVIPVVTLGVYFTFVYDLYASVEFYFGATKYVMYASVTGAVLNLVLNAIFIPMFGFIAAAYTTLVCYIVFMLMHYIFSQKVIKEQGINESVYDNRSIFLLSLMISVICLGSMITFAHFVGRMLLIVGIVLLCVLKKKTIRDIALAIRR